ncbi:catechol 2,3-dioxygenase-like lactoylglutathione lyase family enzyme [Sphingopyxis panaciterrae]|uniref:VOC family protein n=1 Tax=Sphingopyxis panaciterrae TaxID=363841 RepID=UPI001FB95E3A|nr:VOC family protein [Sphingopyxis panaciterrae]NIJ36945.1 catechol 2,3-dioxygenase-like lactoylglutathione lyase family enzyme [Sphingopyxis panaciterrae]
MEIDMPGDNIPFSMAGLDHIVLRVSNLQTMLAFYHDVLGCTDERTQAEIGLFQLRAGRSLIDLVTIDGKLGAAGGAAAGAEGRNLDHFALAISPFDESAIRAHLAHHHVEIEQSGPRYGAEGEGSSVYFRDPEGNLIELKGPGEQSV